MTTDKSDKAAKPKPTAWEYMVFDIPGGADLDLQEKLNEFGLDGWEAFKVEFAWIWSEPMGGSSVPQRYHYEIWAKRPL